ncbi:hypothetical protein Tco_0524966 [Tanacetum coccineum]
MTTLPFADTNNLVAFLDKPTESKGFKQIVDFLNASSLRYDLTVNPTIYTSCIQQFWATAKVKTINGEVQLQALVDGTKVIITETCKLTFYKAFFSPQWKFLIHTILQCLSANSTAWNQFSSTMASTIICLATNQKFNFSKYIFESMVKNVDSSVKFLMYPRVGKGFSGAVTPLFPTMMVQAQEEIEPVVNKVVYKERGDSMERAATTASSLEAEQDSGGRPRRQETMGDRPAQTWFESLSKQSNDPPPSRVKTLGSGEEKLKLKELMDLCTKLYDRVLDLETTKTAQAKEIASLKKRVKKLERKRKSKTLGMKRLSKIGRSARVISSVEDSLGDQEDASKQGRKITDIDQDAEVKLVDETQGRYDDAQMFDTYVFNGEEVFVAEQSEKVVEEVVLL